MTTYTAIRMRAFSQFALLIAIIFGIGYFQGNHISLFGGSDSHSVKTEAPASEKTETYTSTAEETPASEETQLTRLAATKSPAYDYPDMKFGSDEAWDDYLSSSRAKNLKLYKGVGHIAGQDVSMVFGLRPDGTMIGRYRHSNGTQLDVNGYVSSYGDLYIHLGHASERSNWHLEPTESKSTTDRYVYDGTWGRRNKPSRMAITPVN